MAIDKIMGRRGCVQHPQYLRTTTLFSHLGIQFKGNTEILKKVKFQVIQCTSLKNERRPGFNYQKESLGISRITQKKKSHRMYIDFEIKTKSVRTLDNTKQG